MIKPFIRRMRDLLEIRSDDAERAQGGELSLVTRGDDVCGMTDVGRVRQHNEDAFHISQDGRLLIVADGMGGHAAGEVASALAIQAVVDFFTNVDGSLRQSSDMPMDQLLRRAFELAQDRVCGEAEGREELRGMGTTLIAACIVGGKVYTCHVGDVRCYVHSASGLKQLTEDHSVVGELVRAGQLSPEQARVHPYKNQIFQAIGLPQGITPGVNSSDLESRDIVLLCSDGLWEANSDVEIDAVLKQEASIKEKTESLIRLANEAGGNDNITVVLYSHVQEPSEAR